MREVDIVERYISFKPEKKTRLFDLSIKPIIYQSNIQKIKKNYIINNEKTNDNYINNENSNYKFYFQKVISRDDQGILISSIKENHKYAFYSHEYQYILKNDEELFEEKRETFFYFVSFYLIKNISKYNRSFMKIPDLTAMVGTLIKIEIFFFLAYYQIFLEKF